MKRAFIKEVETCLTQMQDVRSALITDQDLEHLPIIIQKYLRNCRVVGKEKVQNMRVVMAGKIRSNPGDPWMKLKSVQYNFFSPHTRIFYIRALKMGIPATGLHLYKNEKASMVIRLAGLFTVADAKGPEMDQGETVTVLNDMCFMAPGTLISKDIRWEILEPTVVKANFTNGSIKVSAILYFDENGNIQNFISNDRFETKDGKKYMNYPWSTPVKAYREINGIKMPAKAEAIYHHPDGEFCYAEFIIKEISYNEKMLQD